MRHVAEPVVLSGESGGIILIRTTRHCRRDLHYAFRACNRIINCVTLSNGRLMNKFLTLMLIVLTTPLVAGAYGIVHDQLTYSISPEYYTEFKFYQFGLKGFADDSATAFPRLAVAQVGFMATWWVGLFSGIILGLVGLRHGDSKLMLRATARATMLMLIIAFGLGLVGLAIGFLIPADPGPSWRIPDNLVDRTSFIAVGSMHNFSYLGGLVGLIIAVVYSIRLKTTTQTDDDTR